MSIKKVFELALIGSIAHQGGLSTILIYVTTVLLLVAWPFVELFGRGAGDFRIIVACASGVSLIFLFAGYFFNRPEEPEEREGEQEKQAVGRCAAKNMH